MCVCTGQTVTNRLFSFPALYSTRCITSATVCRSTTWIPLSDSDYYNSFGCYFIKLAREGGPFGVVSMSLVSLLVPIVTVSGVVGGVLRTKQVINSFLLLMCPV